MAGMTVVAAAETRRVYFGTSGQEPAKGIYVADFDMESGAISGLKLAAEARNPGFLAMTKDGGHLYATGLTAGGGGKRPTGAVTAFTVKGDGTLKTINALEAGGGTCFVTLDSSDRTVLAANYGEGSVASFRVADDGSLDERVSYVKHEGSGSNKQRQGGPHAHSFYPGPDNRFAYAPDLGIDEVVIYSLDAPTAEVKRVGTAKTPPGAGPRHMKFSRDGKQAYVLGELSLKVIVYDRDAESGALTLKQDESVLAEGADGSGMTCSEILVSPDGRFVFTANRDVAGRKRDSLTTFAIGEGGRLKRIHEVAAKVEIPRNIQLSPDGKWLLVAGQKAGGVPVFEVGADGKPAFAGHRADVPNAMCIVFSP